MVKEFSIAQRKMVVDTTRKFKSAPATQTALRAVGLEVSISTIKRLKARARKKQSLANRKGRGRPRKTSKTRDNAIKLRAIRNRKKSFTQLATEETNITGISVSRKPVARRLKDRGFCRRVAKRRPGATQIQKDNRLQFANTHKKSPTCFATVSDFVTKKFFPQQMTLDVHW